MNLAELERGQTQARRCASGAGLNPDIRKGKLRKLLGDQRGMLWSCKHKDMLRRNERQHTRYRLLQERSLPNQVKKLLGISLSAPWPKSRTASAGEDGYENIIQTTAFCIFSHLKPFSMNHKANIWLPDALARPEL